MSLWMPTVTESSSPHACHNSPVITTCNRNFIGLEADECGSKGHADNAEEGKVNFHQHLAHGVGANSAT